MACLHGWCKRRFNTYKVIADVDMLVACIDRHILSHLNRALIVDAYSDWRRRSLAKHTGEQSTKPGGFLSGRVRSDVLSFTSRCGHD